uniref:Checkpoint protein n=1 Tax=Acrobeloides nanus TaxID=290746 RepID=A0A914D7B7_9BILA
MSGIDAEHNEIIFEIEVANLLHSMTTTNDNFVHLKLVRKDVDLQPVRMWNMFNPPNIGSPSVSVYMPTLKTLQKMITSIKIMGAKHELRANTKGELKMDAVLEQAKINVYINDLSNLTTTVATGTSGNTNEAPAQFHVVRLNLKQFHNFFNLIPYTFNKILMRIFDNRVVNFIINEADCQLIFYMGGLNVD